MTTGELTDPIKALSYHQLAVLVKKGNKPAILLDKNNSSSLFHDVYGFIEECIIIGCYWHDRTRMYQLDFRVWLTRLLLLSEGQGWEITIKRTGFLVFIKLRFGDNLPTAPARCHSQHGSGIFRHMDRIQFLKILNILINGNYFTTKLHIMWIMYMALDITTYI